MRTITPEQADAAYTVLVRLAGARDDKDDRWAFVHHVARSASPTSEYRFGGSLGSGGKFRNNGNRDNVPHVDCYPEDETQVRKDVIERVNMALRGIFS